MSSISVSVQPSPHAPQSVDVLIKNSAKTPCTFRNPVSDNELQYNAMRVKSKNGEEIPYIGPIILNRNDALTLSPNQSFEFTAYIDESYSLKQKEEYFVRHEFSCKEKSYQVHISNEAKILAYDNLDYKRQIRRDPPDHIVEAQAVTHGTVRGVHKFIGTSNNDLIEQTLEATKAAAAIAKDLITSDPISFNKYYNKFICAAREAPTGNNFIPEVHKTYSDIVKFLEKGVTHSFAGVHCRPKTVAYVYPADPGNVIYLCNAFIHAHTLPNSSKLEDSKLGTIIHEASHKVNPCVIDNYYYLHECLNRLNNSNCTDTNNSLTHLGSCPSDELDWETEQNRTGKNLNLNMYTADCIEYLTEAAYADSNAGWSKSQLAYIAVGIVSLAAAYFTYQRYQQRAVGHPHSE